MKKTLYIRALALLIVQSVSAQNITATDKRFQFFKIWNFVKYYHTDCASGKVNADTLFFNNLEKLDNVKDQREYNSFVTSLIGQLTAVSPEPVTEQSTAALLAQNFDQNWFLSTNLYTVENKMKLLAIFAHRFKQQNHHYIPELSYTTEIPNEAIYSFADTENLPYPMRMLALAKIQGMADYLFPHKYLTDKNLDNTIKQKIEAFASCNSRVAYEKLLLQVTAAFNDTHSYKFASQIKNRSAIFKNTYFPPFSYKVLKAEVVITDLIIPEYCEKAGIKTGDIITAINGTPISKIIDSLSTLLSASNGNALIHRLSDYSSNRMWQGYNRFFALQIQSGKVSVSKNIEFISNSDTQNIPKIEAYLNRGKKSLDNKLLIINKTIAYFKVNETMRFMDGLPDEKIDASIDSLLTIASKQKGIIFDMRGYPDWGGFIQYYVLKKFGKTPNRFANYYEPNKQELGTYVLSDAIATYHRPELVADGNTYNGKVVIIVNSETLSMSEYFTMLLQHIFPKSTTIGEQTAGADGDEKSINLPGNYVFHFTGNAIFYPDNTAAQRKGVKIDKPINLTSQDIIGKKDKLLNEAILLLIE